MTALGGSDHARAVVAHYDERAASYDDSALHRGLTDEVARFIDLDGVRSVLDVATGTGLMLRAIAARIPQDRPLLIGLDLSPAMVAVARPRLPGAGFLVGDATEVLLPDASFDLITCVTALHLFEQPDAVFAEWARLLTPGGRVVTASFGAAPEQVVAPPAGGFVRRHESFRTPELVADALAPHGFRLARDTTWEHADDRLLICELVRP